MKPRESAQSQEIQVIPAGEVVEAQESAAIDKQIATAKAHPRSIPQARREIRELAASSPEVADRCWYDIPRGDGIDGPSVRLAEIVAHAYTNLRVGARIVSVDEHWVTCQGVAHDLEKNNAVTAEVKRSITKRNGDRFSEDLIVVTANAGCSIAMRNAIFKAIPTALFQDIFEEVKEKRLESEGLEERKRNMFEYLKSRGVTEEQVCDFVGKDTPAKFDASDVANVRGAVTAIRDGSTTIEDTFGKEEKKSSGLTPGRHDVSRKAKAEEEGKAQDKEHPAEKPATEPDAETQERTEEEERDMAALERSLQKECQAQSMQNDQEWDRGMTGGCLGLLREGYLNEPTELPHTLAAVKYALRVNPESELTDVKGMGKATVKRLKKYFGLLEDEDDEMTEESVEPEDPGKSETSETAEEPEEAGYAPWGEAGTVPQSFNDKDDGEINLIPAEEREWDGEKEAVYSCKTVDGRHQANVAYDHAHDEFICDCRVCRMAGDCKHVRAVEEALEAQTGELSY